MRVVPFLNVVEHSKKDLDLADKLKLELPGVLNWALDGLRQYWSQGLISSPAMIYASKRFRSDSDSVATFIEEICSINAAYQVEFRILHDKYVQWCEANGAYEVSSVGFGKRLTEMGFGSRESNGKHFEWEFTVGGKHTHR